MTTKDFSVKWLAYALALLPVWFLDAYLLSRFPVFGVCPMLLPLCAAAVATLEGASAGAGFGLAVGILFEASAVSLLPGTMTFLFALLGLGCGLLSQYGLRQDFFGHLICSTLWLLGIDALRIAARIPLGGAAVRVMFSLAWRETLWSLCFTPLVYLHFRWVFRRVPKPTVL